ncbi:Rcs stress response system protein RcsF [Arsenophonus sp. aPb]|uniref:Rcs stress response system protein RcsF n=1 Tax=Arsenophonus sp. aPb TaxID=3041619 RepID=UPI002469097F|nr:Rcs stress response system protein RcsF [Arsenophonus sp. aPb]WGL98838.1 Rcs stress response system protein RcsF [Arsenophonus sp. aPb]
MRLLLCCLTLCISGCNLLSPTEYNKQDNSLKKQKNVINKISPQKGSVVKVIDKKEALLGKPYKDLGIVSGISCQPNRQDPSVSIPLAKKNMLKKASSLGANIVLLHRCEIISTSDCYQTAICEGFALNIINE